MILIINTSGTGLEFVLDDKYTHIDQEKQSVALPLAVENFLNQNGAKWSDLTAIGVVTGPGSFTGIRLGIAYAKGLGLGLNIPVIPIPNSISGLCSTVLLFTCLKISLIFILLPPSK